MIDFIVIAAGVAAAFAVGFWYGIMWSETRIVLKWLDEVEKNTG